MNKLASTLGLGAAALIAIALAPRLMAATAPVQATVVPTPDPIADAQEQSVSDEVEADQAQRTEEPAQSALVEVVFVLDTTGSMGGLLDGAKDTVWSILDTFVSQSPQPEIRIGIVAYRDRGDTYVTRDLPLTDDLDAAHAFLRSLRADGGGDSPESVGRALWVATDSMEWTTDRDKTFRTIFLVGDAPSKAYPDEASPTAIARTARERGIYVNAVQCGENGLARSQFSRIAASGEGEFVSVAQNGGVVVMSTPYDDELATLEVELAATALPYGEKGRELDRSIAESAGMLGSVRASRRSTLSKLGVGLGTSGGDLVAELGSGALKAADVSADELPDAWKALTAEEREADAAERLRKRAVVEEKLAEITEERDGWVRTEKTRRTAESGPEYSFDSMVEGSTVEALRTLGYVE